MALRWKLVALALLPLLVATVVVALQVWARANRLANQQVSLVETSLLQAKRSELVHTVELLQNQVQAVVDTELDETRAEARVRALIASARYGSDGYFFANDLDGVCLVHGRQPELVGKNLWDLRDARGSYVIRSLIASALHGDGFFMYQWERPSTKLLADKLAYVARVPRWGWVFGTGVYLDDIAATSRVVRGEARASVERTMWRIATIALLAIALVFSGTLLVTISEQRLADRRLRAANHALVTLRSKERARIARQLHESALQVLAATKFRFELAQQALPQEPNAARKDLASGLERLSECIGEVRRVSHALRPLAIERLGWARALRQLCDDFAARTRVELRLVDVLPEAPPEPYAAELYQIAQGALANVENWARAAHVDITLARTGAELSLRVVDDGVGFDPELATRDARAGIGLRNLRERVEDLNGVFELVSRPGRTELSARFNLETL